MTDEKEPAVVAAGGWCAPSEAVYEFENATKPFDPIPEVRVLRGETFDEMSARIAAYRERQRAAALAAGISVAALEATEGAPDGAGPGRWEYAIRFADGEYSESYDSAQEAHDMYGMDPGDEMVRRWVLAPLEWETLQ